MVPAGIVARQREIVAAPVAAESGHYALAFGFQPPF